MDVHDAREYAAAAVTDAVDDSRRSDFDHGSRVDREELIPHSENHCGHRAGHSLSGGRDERLRDLERITGRCGSVEEGTRRIETLFVPFADQTTGTETYSAGRYLDLHPTPTGIYAIDFNRAYNPYCAYNDTYECPFPPPSNRLKLAIRAGEKAPGA